MSGDFFERGAQKSKTRLDFFGSPSHHMMGLGGVEVGLPTTFNFFTTVLFLQLCILSWSPSPSPHKMGLGGVEVALPATLGNCGAAFCENTHGDG